ncbi:MAG: rRNA (guanine2445-N2)-methyltransferase [Candidatus Cloacimonadota bacterium]|nr:rRNA (guanine2445-N2)-methyltransferase [Candidatus Cloacimonadota bacterium]
MQRYFAVVAGSLEKHARPELEALGAKVLAEQPRGLDFAAEAKDLYRILYASRLIQRVLLPLLSFDCHSYKYLYRRAKQDLNWPKLFAVEQSFGIICNVSDSFTRHSLYSSQILKDAICDSFREYCAQRPTYTNKNPDILFNLHIHRNKATISLDLLGISMHKRGYRKQSVEAPLQETLAAAIVKLSNWDGQSKLWDLMCGSGTLLAEAAMLYCRIPAGYLRDNHRVEFMPNFERRLWEQMKCEEDSQIRELPVGLIQGSDINPQAVKAARENLNSLPSGKNIDIKQQNWEDFEGNYSGTIISNPPYGVRLDSRHEINKFYNALGDFLKQKCKGSTAYILCGNKDLVKELRLRAHWKKTLKNADLDTVLAKIMIR